MIAEMNWSIETPFSSEKKISTWRVILCFSIKRASECSRKSVTQQKRVRINFFPSTGKWRNNGRKLWRKLCHTRDWDRKMPIYKNRVTFFLLGDCAAPLSCKTHCFPWLINLKRKLLVISNFQRSYFLFSVLCGSCLSLSSIVSTSDLSRGAFSLSSLLCPSALAGEVALFRNCEASGTRHPHHAL